jgi:hypothetical protein
MSKKKLLIITYYWPPAGGPGVQRWLKFVKYLPQFNVHPIVYTPKNAAYPLLDDTLNKDLNQVDFTLIQKEINEPNQWMSKLFKKKTKTISAGVIKPKEKQSLLEKALLFIRGNFFIPDSRKTWVKPSIDFLKNYINQNPVDAIITTGPPHSMHLIGLALKKETGIPWIADFRDPWYEINYQQELYLLNYAKKRHQTLELNVLQEANMLLTTSNATKKLLEQKTKSPITVITNGYDDQKSTVYKKDENFTLSHIGSLLSNRNPIILWEAIAELIKENSNFSQHFELKLIGKVSQDILDTLTAFGLIKHTQIIHYVSHEKAIKAQKESQVLLLIEENSEAGSYIIAGKLFEYLVSDTPILAIGPKVSDVKTIINETNTGKYFNYDEKEQLKNQLLNFFEAYEKNELKNHPIGLQTYHRKALTQKLVNSIPWA